MKRNHDRWQPKEIPVKYSALNLPEGISTSNSKSSIRKVKELLNDKNRICKEPSSHLIIFSVHNFPDEKINTIK